MIYIGVISGLSYFLIIGHIFTLLCLPSLPPRSPQTLNFAFSTRGDRQVLPGFPLSVLLPVKPGWAVSEDTFKVYLVYFSFLRTHFFALLMSNTWIWNHCFICIYIMNIFICIYIYIFLVLCCFLVTPFEEEVFQMSFYIIWKTVLWTSTSTCLQQFHLHFSLWLHWCQVELTRPVAGGPVSSGQTV